MNGCRTLTQAPMRFVRMNGVELAYFEMGGGIPLSMIHGWPSHSYGWRKLTVPSEFDKRTAAADIDGLLDDLGPEKVIAVGHDWEGLPEEDPEWCATRIRNFVSRRFSETAFGNKGEETRP
jgi:pimeloyl-ACP methyl ester carboxylesterase